MARVETTRRWKPKNFFFCSAFAFFSRYFISILFHRHHTVTAKPSKKEMAKASGRHSSVGDACQGCFDINSIDVSIMGHIAIIFDVKLSQWMKRSRNFIGNNAVI